MMERIKVFLSYRRADTPHVAGRLGDRIAQRCELFMDIDNIPLGMDFAKVVREAVKDCDALVALIGPHWLDAVDDDGQRRLLNPDDWVVAEIKAGLDRDITVIPVLVDGAVMPESEDLPLALRSLPNRQALTLGHPSFGVDADRLLRALERLSRPTSSASPESLDASPAAEADLYQDLQFSRALAAMFNQRWDEPYAC